MAENNGETFQIQGGQLLEKVRSLIHEGNVRRITVKQRGHVVAEFPLTVGVVGTIFAPILAAIGALTALLAECTIEVERAGKKGRADTKKAPSDEKKELAAVN